MAVAAETAPNIEHQIDYELRHYYDTVTWLAEVLPGSMRTPSEYRFDGHELYATDGSPMGKVFDDAIEQAKSPVGEHSFEYRRRLVDKQEYRDMIAMMRDEMPNTMVVVSDFPPELMDATADVDGYNIRRKQTMLRVLSKTPDGSMKMYSQSLDLSDRVALEQMYRHLGFEPEPGELLGQRMHLDLDAEDQDMLVDRLMGVYDRSLGERYAGEWYAGQRGTQRINTYEFVRCQSDLLQAYLATATHLTGGASDYNLAAAMEARFRANPAPMRAITPGVGVNIAANSLALHEMERAGARAQAMGKVYSGCELTAAMTKESEDGSMAKSQLEEAGYGNQAGTDKYGSLQFKCPKKGCLNNRPPGKLIKHCQKCGADVTCK